MPAKCSAHSAVIPPLVLCRGRGDQTRLSRPPKGESQPSRVTKEIQRSDGVVSGAKKYVERIAGDGMANEKVLDAGEGARGVESLKDVYTPPVKYGRMH